MPERILDRQLRALASSGPELSFFDVRFFQSPSTVHIMNDTSSSGPVTTTSQLTPTTPSPRLAYSVHETACMLGVCDKSVRRLILRRLIRPSRALRHILIPKDEIERFLRETR